MVCFYDILRTCIIVSMSMKIIALAKDFQIFSIAKLRTEK